MHAVNRSARAQYCTVAQYTAMEADRLQSHADARVRAIPSQGS
jgi:hypothetical protein